jgi:hypothetical protein
VPIAHGHSIYVDSPWALTSISQAQFWKNISLSGYGDGDVRGVISVDISEWTEPGLNGKAARDCSPEEIKTEVWEQLKQSLNYGDQMLLRDEQLHSFSLDPSLTRHKGATANEEPLLVNLVDTWKLRPEAVTKIPNLFLASDYVRTYTDLATMEAANEAARRAVNGILDAARSAASRCGVWQLHEPEICAPWRAIDSVRYAQGLPWDDMLVRLGMSTFELADKAFLALESGSEEHGPYKAAAGLPQYQALVAFADRQAQGGAAGAAADIRRNASEVFDRFAALMALRLAQAQFGHGGVSTDHGYRRRVEIIPR